MSSGTRHPAIPDDNGNEVPLEGSLEFSVVRKKNRHDRQKFDPTGLFQ